MPDPDPSWYVVHNIKEVPSPALLVYPDRIDENIRRMIQIAGGVERLRPHMKTHKLAEVIRMQLALGITKFKCATIAEVEMVAGCGAPDVLLAYQPVGPNILRSVQLARSFPHTKFSAVADDFDTTRALSKAFSLAGIKLNLLLDIDCGMHRTGVSPGPAALELYRLIAGAPGLEAGGLHAYDGHIHNSDLKERMAACDAEFTPVIELQKALEKNGLTVPIIVAGGTPTFPIHARRPNVQCSPGTCVLWDFGYANKLPDLEFLPAALVLTRVISKPANHRLCLDLGHKAIASENPHPRVQFYGLAEANPVVHSEEHLVIETPWAEKFTVGDCLYGVPRHICPTAALHAEAVAVEQGCATERWKITARNRTLTI
ncbi:MAG: D-TA family PLP-dependent enzyme [Verrucomicrobia bacterium]|nr:D-TA family PLP-dependent enzyme [Verrucomicrobiota bacterium]